MNELEQMKRELAEKWGQEYTDDGVNYGYTS